MTMQLSEGIEFEGERFSLMTSQPTWIFSPREHGIRPGAASTMCWSGYLASYRVADDMLLLDRLVTGHSTYLPFTENPEDLQPRHARWPSDRQVDLVPPPPLGGVEAVASEGEIFVGRWVYEGLHMRLPFTGRITIANGFVEGLGRDSGLWRYEKVLRLSFEDGALVRTRDLSAEFAMERANIVISLVAHRRGKKDFAVGHDSGGRYVPPGPGERDAELYDDDLEHVAMVRARFAEWMGSGQEQPKPEPLVSATAWAAMAAFLLLSALAVGGWNLARGLEYAPSPSLPVKLGLR